MKGKQLSIGMHVILLKAPKKRPFVAMSGVPLTVRSIEYPFVVFESESKTISSMMMIGAPSLHSFKTSTTMNVKKCRLNMSILCGSKK